MEEKKQRLVLDGNAFYEIDLECLREKEKKRKEQTIKKEKRNRQRN